MIDFPEHLAEKARQASGVYIATIETASWEGYRNNWDVHIHEPLEPWLTVNDTATDQMVLYLRPIGIGFTPAEGPVPSIHRHVERP
jgi:hypothetical protein